MENTQLDRIMIKHMGNKNNQIDIEKTVMSRIKEYENKKSLRLLYWEYTLSGLILCSGLISIFVIQYVFDLYSYVFEFYQINIFTARWLSTGMFFIIVLSVVWIMYFITMLKIGNKSSKKNPSYL